MLLSEYFFIARAVLTVPGGGGEEVGGWVNWYVGGWVGGWVGGGVGRCLLNKQTVSGTRRAVRTGGVPWARACVCLLGNFGRFFMLF